MIEERDDETPDWEVKEQQVPESLRQKWEKQEKAGIRAGVCRDCGYPFTKDDLSCIHCGARTNLTDGLLISMNNWFFKTPMGIISLILFFVALLVYLL